MALSAPPVALGAAATLAVFLPVVLVVRILDPGEDSPLNLLVAASVLAAFPAGGAVAAARAERSRIAHAAAAAGAAWMVSVALTAFRRGFTLSAVLTLLVLVQVTVALAMAGGWLVARRRGQQGAAPAGDGP